MTPTPLGGDPLVDLAESDDVAPRLLRESDDGRAATYGYRGYRFTIEHGTWFGWWCHGGASRPGDLIALCHEAGWYTWRRARIVRKLQRAVDKDLRDEGRRREVTAR